MEFRKRRIELVEQRLFFWRRIQWRRRIIRWWGSLRKLVENAGFSCSAYF